MNFPEVKYYLINPKKGRYELIFEPLNWNEDDKKLVRNQDNWGVFTELSSDLKFVKDAKNYITEVYESQGTEAELILERYVAKETNKGYELDYKGFLDLKTYSLDDEKVSIQFLTGGLQTIIESQFDEAYELERGTDINGNQITALDYDTIYWEGRRIFLESLAESPDESSDFIIFNVQGNNQIAGYPVNLNLTYQSEGLEINSVFQQEKINLTPYEEIYIVQGVVKPNAGGLFKINTSEEAKTFNVKVDYDYFFNYPFTQTNPERYALNLGLVIYENINDQFEFVEIVQIETSSLWYILLQESQPARLQGETPLQEITLEPNQGVALTPYLDYVSATSPGVGSEMQLAILPNYNFSVKLEQNSEFAPTEFDAIRLYDAYNRMLEIYTGQRDKIISDYFKNGQFKDVLLSSGRHIRNLPEARLSVELKDLYETNNYFNLGWSVEKINQTEYFVIEPKRYFFQNTVAIDLGEVSNLKISCKSDLLFKSMQFGNKKAGDYEEVQGLQEYNALTTYVSHLKTSDTKYEVAADIRADLVGAELARRKNYKVAPNTDTRYDNENFLFNCKPYETDKFTPKVWQDVLDAEPIVYDPPTAGNLLLTPFRSMQRHSDLFNAGMKVYQDKFTRYSTGSGEVNVITKLPNEPAYAENGEIVNSELETPIFEAVEYQFNKPINLEINKMLRGKQNINGRKIPNVNFLVKFAYKGEKYTGYILEVSYNGSGEWTLIKNFN